MILCACAVVASFASTASGENLKFEPYSSILKPLPADEQYRLNLMSRPPVSGKQPSGFDGRSILIDRGAIGLRLSLPPLYDIYEPKKRKEPPSSIPSLLEQFQGGTFEIIVRPPN